MCACAFFHTADPRTAVPVGRAPVLLLLRLTFLKQNGLGPEDADADDDGVEDCLRARGGISTRDRMTMRPV